MDETTYWREEQWERIKDSRPGNAGDGGRTGDTRRGIEAVRWLGRPGARPGARGPACPAEGLGSITGADGGPTRGSGQ